VLMNVTVIVSGAWKAAVVTYPGSRTIEPGNTTVSPGTVVAIVVPGKVTSCPGTINVSVSVSGPDDEMVEAQGVVEDIVESVVVVLLCS
jgi:hypothetical protein